MICKICGKQLPEGSNVCKYCGAHVRAAAAPEKKPARRYSKKALARKRIINLIVSLLALLMIAAVVAGVIWSARMAGDKGAASDQTLQQNDQQAEAPDDSEEEEPADAEEEEDAPQRPQGSIIQQRPQEQTPEKEEPSEGETEQPGQQEQPEQPGTTAPEGQTGTQPQTPSGNYTISINRTETTASLNHYRELIVSINEPLPAGVTIVSTTWTSSNPNVVRAEPGKAWGVSVGSATVTGTITLSDGQSLSATCKVNVVESQTGTGTGTGTTTVSGDYVFADSSSRLLTAAELDKLSTYQLWIARNEIYARHGRKFTNADLASYFAGKSWYKGTIEAASFDESLLSSIERQNVDAILAEEASR